MKYENFKQPVLPRDQWLVRLRRSAAFAVSLMVTGLLVGILGYHYFGDLGWIDALLEASMILGGMGPVAVMQNDAVKIFASIYALVSGFLMLSSASIILALVLHRLLHHFHADCPDE